MNKKSNNNKQSNNNDILKKGEFSLGCRDNSNLERFKPPKSTNTSKKTPKK